MKLRWFVAAGLLLLIACMAMSWFAALFESTTPPTATSPAAGAVRAQLELDNGGPDERTSGVDGVRVAADATVQRIEVLVVATDGNPVAGATIRYWLARTVSERERDDAVQQASQDPEVALTKTGMSRVTDAQGLAWIDAASLDQQEGSPLIARHGDLYGSGWVGATDERLLLEVQRDVCLDIEVVDSLGRARPGQVVNIVAQCLSRRSGLNRQSHQTDATDANGKMRLAHAQLDLDLEQDTIVGRIAVSCDQDINDATRIRLAEQVLDMRQLGSTTNIRLVVPAGGSIAVRVSDASGADAYAQVKLCDDENLDLSPAEYDGKLWFHGLPLNRRWTVTANTGVAYEVQIPVVGPTSANEVIEVVVPLAVHRWDFRGRLLRHDGQPVPEAEVEWICPELAIEGTQVCRHGYQLRLISISSSSVTEVTHLELRVNSPFAAPKVFRFDGKYVPGTHQLGDLVLSPPANEQLLASLEVRCDGKSITEGAWARLITGSYKTQDEKEPPCVQRRVGDRIELLGVSPGLPLRVACGHDDCLGLRVPIAIGEHRVIDLQRAARLRLAVVPPEVPWGALTAELQRLDTTGESADARLANDAQTFDWQRLAPGRYRLRIEAFGQIVHEEAELQLAAGANDWPADRSRLDLRGRLRACCIVARSAADPSKQLNVTSLLVPVGAASLPDLDDRKQRENTFVPSPTAGDLLVQAPGFVPVRVHNPRSDVVLDLQPLTRLEIQCTQSGATEIRIRVVEDGVRDAMLRAFDVGNDHEPERDSAISNEIVYAPGTELDIAVLREGKPGPPQRVVVGTTDPQQVVFR